MHINTMKFALYSNKDSGTPIGLMPLVTTLILLSVHFISGALDWPASGDIRAQRDFNSAIGMSVLTGYFWFALRLMHQNVASTVISLLVKTNQLSQFGAHRKRLAVTFNHHLFNAMIISIMITVIYCIMEGLIATQQEVHVLLLTATAVPFWFLALLFLFQIFSKTSYLINNILSETMKDYDRLNSIITILKLSTTNSIFAMGALAIFPVFWLNKEIPSLDIMGVTFFTGFIAFYLFLPVIKLRKKLTHEKCIILRNIESDINTRIKCYAANDDKKTGASIEVLESEKENIAKLTRYELSPKDKFRVFACIALIPISWCILLVTEWVINIS